MKCPNCGDKITGVIMMMSVSGVIYAESEDGMFPHVDLCSYPELESEAADPGTPAECMDCYHKAELRDFFPGDPNA